jgi:hypothetical protein
LVPGWIKRLKDMITYCHEQAEGLRQAIFAELEESMFFFNDFVDLPLVNEEQ